MQLWNIFVPVAVAISSQLSCVYADKRVEGVPPSFHPNINNVKYRHHKSPSFLFLPISSTSKKLRNGVSNISHQKHRPVVAFQNTPSWNTIPRGGQQSSTNSLRTYSTALFDGSIFSAVATSSPFLQYNIAIFMVNLLGMMISLLFPGIQYHLDLLGTGSFAFASYSTLINGVNSPLLRVKLSSAAVIIWSVKLAAFLFYRALKVNEDARLAETLSTKSGVVFFWLISFFWGVISSLPHSLGTASSSDGNDIGLYSGALVYFVGLVLESVADYQKWTWKQANPGKFCRTGLWSISQHPNFVGNILIWSGITLMNVPSLSWRMIPIACLSPLILWQFFLGQAQGSITSGVELAIKKYGGDKSYGDYIASVPLLFPNLKR